MKYTTVKNPQWNQDKTKIDCFVNFDDLGEVPFTADPNDLPHCQEIYQRCIAGDFGAISDYKPIKDEVAQQIKNLAPNQLDTVVGAEAW
jgi:hypothetical protein